MPAPGQNNACGSEQVRANSAEGQLSPSKTVPLTRSLCVRKSFLAMPGKKNRKNFATFEGLPQKETTKSQTPEFSGPNYDFDNDPRWRNKPLTPNQLLVHDIRLESLRQDAPPRLEVSERRSGSLVPPSASETPPAAYAHAVHAAENPIDQVKLSSLEDDYGWMRHLRLTPQTQDYDSFKASKCRWIHCSSKFSEYLSGFLWGLSDELVIAATSIRLLEHAIQRNTRFSKHGKYFVPFCESLQPDPAKTGEAGMYPLLLSVPFLDWTVLGKTPPLRFQVDKRHGYASAKSSMHPIRSILQHFFRLEDTEDRESSQVFARHKPWTTDREMDLKVRQWYGHYPSGLDVDELWILAIDAEHIVTFSSNQTWKSRWPPLQLSSRISDISFRGIRDDFFQHDENREYTAMTHVFASLSGAVGMLHRNFWPDIVLCLTDRYAGYLGHLQYRLHRSPSTKLVLDLISCQEELNIVVQITQQQISMIADLQSMTEHEDGDPFETAAMLSHRRPLSSDYAGEFNDGGAHMSRHRRESNPLRRRRQTSTLTDPLAQLADHLERELVDLQDLRDNTDRLVTRTIQLVNIRLEDHGRAIIVFTVVTIIFLPLSFVSSFFGINTVDIRNLQTSQWLFWVVAILTTLAVVGISMFLAFKSPDIWEQVGRRKEIKREKRVSRRTARRQKWTGARHRGGLGAAAETDVEELEDWPKGS
nr:hypothetical protein CFP56_50802 [Quercus suber]